MTNFNSQQIKAITAPLGQTLVIAGAGSGKTSVLTNRIIYLIENQNFSPNEILGITFTNKAANEMKERLKKSNYNNFYWIGTFHAICLKILREDIHHLNRQNNFSILDEDDQINIIKEFMKKNNMNIKDYPHKVIVSHISKFKNLQLNFDELINQKNWNNFRFKNLKEAVDNRRIINYYLEYCKKHNLLDFDDLLLVTLDLLKNTPIKDKWQNKLKYVLIDEFQDTNNIQYELISLLSQKYKNIFAVGDPDQMIYSFRGANENIINDFQNDYPKAEIIILNYNYRSSQQILNAANNLIKNNLNRIDKELITTKMAEKPIFYNADSQHDESMWVAKKVMELIDNGYNANDIAILYRSNYLSRSIEEVFFTNNIAYSLYGGTKFYNRKEIKDMIAYLRAIYFHEELCLKRIINIPRRGISEKTIEIIDEYSLNNNLTFYDALLAIDQTNLNSATKNAIKKFIECLNKCYSDDILNTFDNILNIAGYKQYLIDNEQNERLNNLDELRNGIINYQNENENSTFTDYLQDIAIYSINEENKNNKTVQLMTIHNAKGLEFKCVFIIGLNENIFPSKKSLDIGNKGLEEERRIAYVGITRAQEKLFISSFQGFNPINSSYNSKSRFIDEISKLYYEQATTEYKRINYHNEDDLWYDSKKQFDANKQYSKKQEQFQIGDKIIHNIFGEGIVIGVHDDSIDISFTKLRSVKTLISNHIAIRRIAK